MKKFVINENQRGLLFKDGKLEKLLGAGSYKFWRQREVEILPIDSALSSSRCSIDTLLANEDIKNSVNVYEVPAGHYGMRFVNGISTNFFKEGRYVYFKTDAKEELMLFDTSKTMIEDVPSQIIAKIPGIYYTKVSVESYQKALLYLDNQFVKVLEPGTYYFWKNPVSVFARTVDTRLQRMDIACQEILTQDKVNVRINFVCNYRVSDVVKAISDVDSYEEQIRLCAQLAMRDYVGKYKLDEILENKDAISKYVFDKLVEKEEALSVSFVDAGVKDIILPGEIRSIMNTVLMAEKKAQASVIARREEVASTRSLLNTAKLMDENATLYKLKELEYLERICEKVDTLNLSGGSSAITDLVSILKGPKA